MPGPIADNAALRQQLNAALLGHDGSSGSTLRARKSFHYKIIGGFLAELEAFQSSIGGTLGADDQANLDRCREYIAWLEVGGVPQRYDPLPGFVDSPTSGPTLFPTPVVVVVAPTPDTPASSSASEPVAQPSTDLNPRPSHCDEEFRARAPYPKQ